MHFRYLLGFLVKKGVQIVASLRIVLYMAYVCVCVCMYVYVPAQKRSQDRCEPANCVYFCTCIQ